MKKTVPPKNISKCLKKIFNWLSHSLICMNKPTDPVLVSILLTLNNIPPLFQFIYCWLLTCFWLLDICLFKVSYKDRRIKPNIAALVFRVSTQTWFKIPAQNAPFICFSSISAVKSICFSNSMAVKAYKFQHVKILLLTRKVKEP